MGNRGRSGATMAMALAALTAATAGLAQGSPNLRSMIFVTGSCERLTTPGRDRSASCRSTVVNLTYRGGRTSFAFTEADTAMVSFSGTREIRAGDRVTLILDMISVASNPGPTLDSAAATGSCDYSNPYAGRS